MAITHSKTADFSVQNEGTICLLRPHTTAAQEWIDQHLASDRLTFGDAVAVEHRFISDIVAAIQRDGLAVR